MGWLIYLLGLIILASVAWASFSLAPWVPTRKRDLPRIASLTRLEPGEIFYDLGCGDGRVAAYIAANSEARAVGVELAIPFYLISKLRQYLSGNRRLEFKYRNLFAADLTAADAVYMFSASPERLTGKLERKLSRELKSGSRIISYAFPIQGWTPVQVDKPTDKEIAIYVYEKS